MLIIIIIINIGCWCMLFYLPFLLGTLGAIVSKFMANEALDIWHILLLILKRSESSIYILFINLFDFLLPFPFLVWVATAWVSSSCEFHKLFLHNNLVSSSTQSVQSLSNLQKFSRSQIPWIKGSHEEGNTLKFTVTRFVSSMVSPMAISSSLIRETCWHYG